MHLDGEINLVLHKFGQACQNVYWQEEESEAEAAAAGEDGLLHAYTIEDCELRRLLTIVNFSFFFQFIFIQAIISGHPEWINLICHIQK